MKKIWEVKLVAINQTYIVEAKNYIKAGRKGEKLARQDGYSKSDSRIESVSLIATVKA